MARGSLKTRSMYIKRNETIFTNQWQMFPQAWQHCWGGGKMHSCFSWKLRFSPATGWGNLTTSTQILNAQNLPSVLAPYLAYAYTVHKGCTTRSKCRSWPTHVHDPPYANLVYFKYRGKDKFSKWHRDPSKHDTCTFNTMEICTHVRMSLKYVHVRVSRELNLVDSDHNFFKKRDRTEGNTKYQSALHTVRVRKASRTFCY